MGAPWFAVSLPQDRDTPVSIWQVPGFECRYAYWRSADAVAVNEVGQDYLAFAANNRTLVFALCDGVSMSFCGELAARYLGEALLQWLRETPVQALTQEDLQTSLARHLQDLTPEANALVLNVDLPESLPPMLRQVLEQKRTLGSETTFVCGRVDLPTQSLPAGRLALAWMGDSVARLWSETGELEGELKGRFRSSECWSTRSGLVGGEPNILVSHLSAEGTAPIRSVATYSDGLKVLSRFDHLPEDADLRAMIAECNLDPLSDDISFLEIQIPQGSAYPRGDADVNLA